MAWVPLDAVTTLYWFDITELILRFCNVIAQHTQVSDLLPYKSIVMPTQLRHDSRVGGVIYSGATYIICELAGGGNSLVR